MRLLESASLLSLAFALFALAFRVGAARLWRSLFAATGGLMALQALVEGARWQLAPAYVVTAIGLALALRRSPGPPVDGKIRRVARAAGAATGLLGAGLLPVLLPVPSFPAPEGQHPVGTVTFMLQDPAREDAGQGRRLMAQAWYPADASAAGSPNARYMPDVLRTGPAIARLFGLPPFFANHLAYASSHSHENAAFAPSVGRAPLLIFSHGFRFTHSASTTTAEALASQGYIVIALEHTYDAAAVVFPDGTVALTRARVPDNATDEEAANIKASWVLVRAADVRFVIDMVGATGAPVPDVLVGHIDAARVGVFGHSLGGATAAEVCRTDARVIACADLDGSIYGEALRSGVAQPFLLVENDARDHAMDAFVARLRGPSCRVRVARVAHMDFTDVTLLSPIIPYLIRGTRRGERGEDTLRETNRMVTAFFDATLRDDRAAWPRVTSARPRFSFACDHLPAP